METKLGWPTSGLSLHKRARDVFEKSDNKQTSSPLNSFVHGRHTNDSSPQVSSRSSRESSLDGQLKRRSWGPSEHTNSNLLNRVLKHDCSDKAVYKKVREWETNPEGHKDNKMVNWLKWQAPHRSSTLMSRWKEQPDEASVNRVYCTSYTRANRANSMPMVKNRCVAKDKCKVESASLVDELEQRDCSEAESESNTSVESIEENFEYEHQEKSEDFDQLEPKVEPFINEPEVKPLSNPESQSELSVYEVESDVEPVALEVESPEESEADAEEVLPKFEPNEDSQEILPEKTKGSKENNKKDGKNKDSFLHVSQQHVEVSFPSEEEPKSRSPMRQRSPFECAPYVVIDEMDENKNKNDDNNKDNEQKHSDKEDKLKEEETITVPRVEEEPEEVAAVRRLGFTIISELEDEKEVRKNVTINSIVEVMLSDDSESIESSVHAGLDNDSLDEVESIVSDEENNTYTLNDVFNDEDDDFFEAMRRRQLLERQRSSGAPERDVLEEDAESAEMHSRLRSLRPDDDPLQRLRSNSLQVEVSSKIESKGRSSKKIFEERMAAKRLLSNRRQTVPNCGNKTKKFQGNVVVEEDEEDEH